MTDSVSATRLRLRFGVASPVCGSVTPRSSAREPGFEAWLRNSSDARFNFPDHFAIYPLGIDALVLLITNETPDNQPQRHRSR